MGLTAGFTTAELRGILNERISYIEKFIVDEFKYLGEQLVTHARTQKTYQDQTGNLTASIGYALAIRGVVHSLNFPSTKEGAELGKKLASDIASAASQGYTLTVVAAMDYAAEVESKGYDVISTAELLNIREFPKLKAKLLARIERMK